MTIDTDVKVLCKGIFMHIYIRTFGAKDCMYTFVNGFPCKLVRLSYDVCRFYTDTKLWHLKYAWIM